MFLSRLPSDVLSSPRKSACSMTISSVIERFSPGAADHLEQLFDAALDAVVGMDHEGKIIAWNRTAAGCFGWARQDVLGRSLSETIIPERLRTAHQAGLDRYRRTGSGPVLNARVQVTGMRRDGSEFPVELTIIPLGIGEQQVFYAFLRDITERNRLDVLARQRLLEAQILYEATSLIAQGGTEDEIFRHLLRNICQLSGWTVGHVYRPDVLGGPNRLIPTGIWHAEVDALDSLRVDTLSYSMREGEGLPGRIWASGEPAWIEDIEADPGFPRRDLYVAHGLRAAFGFPVLLDGKLEAVLEFFSRRPQKPDDAIMLVARSLAEQLGRVLERQKAIRQRELLLRELDHRVCNSMAVLTAIFRSTAADAGDVPELTEKFESRLQNLVRTHHLLAANGGASVPLRDLIRSSVEADAGDPDRIAIGGDMEMLVSGQQATNLSVVFNELASNAARHGALSTSGGEVSLSWEVTADPAAPQFRIQWLESGGPTVPDARTRGYGSALIEGIVARALQGRVHLEFGPTGVSAAIFLPTRHFAGPQLLLRDKSARPQDA